MRSVIKTISVLLLIMGLFFAGKFVVDAYIGNVGANPPVPFVVEAGMTGEQVADRLVEKGVVNSSAAYRFYGRLDDAVSRPKIGSYDLRPGTSYREIARVLALGPARNEVEIRLIEGWTVDDIAKLLFEAHGVAPSSTARIAGRSVNRAPFDPVLRDEYPFLEDLSYNRSLEGYLAPDTYRVWADQLPDSLIRKQLDEFGQKYGKTVVPSSIAPLKTLDDVVIMASIVEREVRTFEDRRLVAGIFLNRLRNRMRLQTDATLSYLTGSGRARSTAQDLAIDSPYNTYANDGLPPSPVGNPSESSMRAVLDPADTDFFYFLTDDQGKVYYGRTLEEHGENRVKAGF